MKGLFARAGVAIVAGGSLMAFGLVASTAPAGVTAGSKAPSAAVVREARAAFIKDMSSHPSALHEGKGWVSPSLRHPGLAKASNGSVTGLVSANWSGYADAESSSSTRVTYVSGRWTLPAVRCPTRPYQNSDAFIADWVGVDGATDSTVEQLGSAAQCFEGVTYYYIWYEMYPNNTVQEGTAACISDNVDCPRPGDQISASVTVTPGTSGNNNYTLTMHDYTTRGNNFSVTQSCAASTCLDSSGEWIVERPAVLPPFGIQILPSADFRYTGFERGDLVSAGKYTSIAGFKGGPVYDIAMTDDTASYYLDCVGQREPTGTLLLTTDTSACPTVAPGWNGKFFATWDAGF
jgi:Peptidase A4 family